MRSRLFLVMGLVVVLISSFLAADVLASTGCFTDTNGHWAETFICWLKDNNIASGYPDGTFRPGNSITRAEVAVLLQKANNIPPASGQTIIEGDVTGWRYTNSAAPILSDYSGVGYTAFQRTAIGYNYLRISPTIPVALYGKSLQFTGFELCYLASADATLSDLYAYTSLQTNSPVGTNTTVFTDTTDRTDTACRYYALPAPVTLTPETSGIYIRPGISWNTANAWFYIGRTTIVLQPTETNVVTPSTETSFNDNDVLLLSISPAQSDEDIRP